MAVIPSDFTTLDPRLSHEVVTVGSPVAGAGFTRTVPGDVLWIVRSVSFSMVNAAAAASRIPRVEFLDGSGSVFFAVAAPFHTTTGVTSRFSFGVGINQFGAIDAANIGAPIPELTLVGGLAVRVAVTAMNAGDQISGAALFVDQLPVANFGG